MTDFKVDENGKPHLTVADDFEGGLALVLAMLVVVMRSRVKAGEVTQEWATDVVGQVIDQTEAKVDGLGFVE